MGPLAFDINVPLGFVCFAGDLCRLGLADDGLVRLDIDGNNISCTDAWEMFRRFVSVTLHNIHYANYSE
ncbi:hypothetical protein PuT2_05915 [Pusillimonas sp. T2]|nr:hypothetical protein PuT2_05915 [Pusillimonas sp. T2]